MYLCHNFECLISTQNTVKKNESDPDSIYILKQSLHKGILKTYFVTVMRFNSSASVMSICICNLANSS